ncbi:hypothetical protein ABK040_013815 [Willaertia magna]
MSTPTNNNEIDVAADQHTITIEDNNNNDGTQNNNKRQTKSLTVDIPMKDMSGNGEDKPTKTTKFQVDSPSSKLKSKNLKKEKGQYKNALPSEVPSKASSNHSNGSLFKIHTCCGVVEMTGLKLACLVGMLVTVIAFLALVAITVVTFVNSRRQNLDLVIETGKLKFYSAQSIVSLQQAILSNNFDDFITYRTYSDYVRKSLKTVKIEIGGNEFQNYLNSTTFEANNKMRTLQAQIFSYIIQGYPSDAINILQGSEYASASSVFFSNIDSFVKEMENVQKDIESQILASTLAQLIIIAIALIIVTPIVVAIFLFAINRDDMNLLKLKRANAIMLMDTMADDHLRNLFKQHCEQEKSSENYNLLEKIHDYKALSERSLELQYKLFDDTTSESASTVSGTDSTNSSNKEVKTKKQLEKEYNEVEAKKYEVAFEIYTDYLDINGEHAVNISKSLAEAVKDQLDQYNAKNIESLPETLFTYLEKEVCIIMLDTHQRFKQSLAFQKEMKIDKINVKKLKVQKKNKF